MQREKECVNAQPGGFVAGGFEGEETDLRGVLVAATFAAGRFIRFQNYVLQACQSKLHSCLQVVWRLIESGQQ